MTHSIDQPQPGSLLSKAQRILRRKHYSYRTELSYLGWIRRFILFHGKRHPVHMGRAEIEAFLSHLAIEEKVAAATQNQAFNAILFLYRTVLEMPIDFPIQAFRARRPKRVPTVLSRDEVQRVLACLTGSQALMAKLLYGSGLRASELLRLRVKDLDFALRQVVVRDGKGSKDRFTILPDSLVEPLRSHLQRIKRIHEQDLQRGYGSVHLPNALERKYPAADREWIWQYAFPSHVLSADPRAGVIRRHHLSPSSL